MCYFWIRLWHSLGFSQISGPMRSKHINSNVYGPCKVNTFQNEPAISFAHLMIWLATNLNLYYCYYWTGLIWWLQNNNNKMAWACLHPFNEFTAQNRKPISHGSVNLMRKLNYHTQRTEKASNNKHQRSNIQWVSNDTPSFYMIVDVATLII